MTRADAPAKMILFGEHAVVYGRPAIALPLPDLRASAAVEPNTRGEAGQIELISPVTATDIWLHEAPSNHPLAAITKNTLTRIERTAPVPLRITVDSTIPLGAGLGSGAAVSVAMSRAIGRYFGLDLEPETLSSLAYEVEIIHHGSPSGIDNTVIAYEKPVFFIRGKTLELFSLDKPISVVLAHSGQVTPTATAVRKVRDLHERKPEFTEACLDEIADLTHRAYKALRGGKLDQLGEWMNRNHTLLQSLGVSTPALDNLVEIAVSAGARGAKLSGAGLGGCMISLVEPGTREAVFQALLEAGASQLCQVEVQV